MISTHWMSSVCWLRLPGPEIMTLMMYVRIQTTGGKRCSNKTLGSMPFGCCGTTATWIPSLFSRTRHPWHRKTSEKHAQNLEPSWIQTFAWFLGIQHCQYPRATLPLSTSKLGPLLSRFGGIPKIETCTDYFLARRLLAAALSHLAAQCQSRTPLP